MAFSASISSSFFTTCPPNFTIDSNPSSKSNSNYVSYRRTPVSAAYATAENRTSSSSKTGQQDTNRSLRNTCSSSLYEVLGVRIGADTREVKAAYRRLARVLHPDVAASSDGSSADEFMRIHSAYTTLSDPEKRADYDRTLFQRPSRAVAASPAVSYANAGGYRSRRWETDQCW